MLRLGRLTAEDHLLAGNCCLELRDWTAAREHFANAQRERETARGFEGLARAWMGDETMSAETWAVVYDLLQRAIKQPHCGPETFALLAEVAHGAQGPADRPEAVLVRGLAVHPESRKLRLALAMELADREPAAARLALQPLPRPTADARYLWCEYRIEERAGDAGRALEILAEIAAEFPQVVNRSWFQELRGIQLLNCGRAEEAKAALESAVDDQDTRQLIRCQLEQARASLALGRQPEAVALARGAIKLWGLCSDQEWDRTSIEIGDSCFLRDPYPSDQARQAFGASDAPECRAVGDILGYLADRRDPNVSPSKVTVLKTLQRRFPLPVLDYDLSLYYGRVKKFEVALQHHVRYALATLSAGASLARLHFYDRPPAELAPTCSGDAVRAHNCLCDWFKEHGRDARCADELLYPLYQKFWRSLLIRQEWHEPHYSVASFFSRRRPHDLTLKLDQGGLAVLTKHFAEGEACCRHVVAAEPRSAAAQYWLSLAIVADERFAESLAAAREAWALAPNSRQYADRVAQLEGRQAAEITARREREAWLESARERFAQLDRYKRRILATLTLVDEVRDLTHLAEISGTGSQYIEGNFRRLVELGMIVEDQGTPKVNARILDLVERERTHALAVTVLRADSETACKPIFNSRLEHSIYKELISVFPNHLVFPNMALQGIFQFERMRDMVDAGTFEYYLKAHVDFCVVSTATYLPLVAFEADSPYHDHPQQQARDHRKNELFRLGGVPLLRLRAHGEPSAESLRRSIATAVESLLEQVRVTPENAGSVSLRLEFDAHQLNAALGPHFAQVRSSDPATDDGSRPANDARGTTGSPTAVRESSTITGLADPE
ncbi:MAG: DUF2726 domain-containing protein [Pirellulales bacterium]